MPVSLGAALWAHAEAGLIAKFRLTISEKSDILCVFHAIFYWNI